MCLKLVPPAGSNGQIDTCEFSCGSFDCPVVTLKGGVLLNWTATFNPFGAMVGSVYLFQGIDPTGHSMSLEEEMIALGKGLIVSLRNCSASSFASGVEATSIFLGAPEQPIRKAMVHKQSLLDLRAITLEF